MHSEGCLKFAGRDKKQPGVAQPAEGAAGEEAQVSSKPVEWPMVPPGSKRQRSRLHQTPGSAPPGATPEELSPHLVRPRHEWRCKPRVVPAITLCGLSEMVFTCTWHAPAIRAWVVGGTILQRWCIPQRARC